MRGLYRKNAARKWNAFFLAVLLALGTCLPAGLAATYPYTSYTNDKVNMRRSASGSSIVLERLEKGQEVTVLGESGNYYKILYNNRTGYIVKQYIGEPEATATVLTKASATATPTAATISGYPYQTTTRDSVNMRRSPSSSSVILERIPEGAALTVEGVSGLYVKATYNGTQGYVMAEYVNVKAVTGATATPTSTPAPTPTEEVNSAYLSLSNGDSGTEIKALQQALAELGFLSGTADGKFGNQTESAVEAFQKKNGMTETGVADGVLQTLLYEGKPKNASGKATTVMTLPPLDGVTIREGNMGDAVTKLQERLKELGYFAGAVSGTCTSQTIAAVKAFQKKHGLTADGLAGSVTQAKLYSDDALASNATATPTPAPIPTPPGETVRQGDEGQAAKTVQQRLKDLGYLSGTVDGKFGTLSVQALIAFQKRHGLTQDGVAGSATQAVLFSSAALSASAEATATPTPTATPLTPDNVIVMQRGTRGQEVLKLQQRLTELGYYTAKMDSDYEAADIAAVKAFQKANGLKVDGIAGYETQVLLYSADAVPGPLSSATPTPEPTPTPSLSTLRQGDTGNEVKSLQQRLIQLGYLDGTADGTFGSGTAAALIAFQKANGLNKDGVAGPTTLAKLYSTAAAAAPTATPAAATLKQGDSSDAVKEMQTLLIDLGYLSGTADGKFGAQTFLALKAFQERNGLLTDGIAGAKTLTLLNSDSAKAAPTVPGATATPKPDAPTLSSVPKASQVRYANWYSEIRARCKLYPYATVYDYSTGLSWKVHMFSLGAHADCEPLTAADTAIMVQAFGGKYTWTPKPVWVVMSDGRVYMASTHDTPHSVQHNTTNNFPGHFCIHFPRTDAQVAAIGPYATSHQKAIDLGWAVTQSMIQ